MESTVIGRLRIEVRGGSLEIVGSKDSSSVPIGSSAVVVGRSKGCTLVVDDKQVSKLHAEFVATEFGVRVRDLGSRNGTYVGEHRVDQAYLTSTATVQCGDTKLRFKPARAEEKDMPKRTEFGRLVGRTPEMVDVFEKLARVAATDISLLILGETGTGKELVAKAVHEAGDRASKPFVVIDCTTVPSALAESTLFGHERGSFTGASERRISPFVEASGGTVFLDELGELPADVQGKLLRALAEKQIKSVGGTAYRSVDVRIIAATRRELRHEINAGQFRSDLYFRIADMTIEMPPLRRRKADIRFLAQRIFAELGEPDAFARCTEDFLGQLERHDWPGNVRELRKALNVALSLSRGEEIETVPEMLQLAEPSSTARVSSARMAAEIQRDVVGPIWRDYYAQLYEEMEGNITEIALRSGITRVTVRRLLRLYGIGDEARARRTQRARGRS
jgi:DNA-binding NtrC family response regulator